MVLRRDGGIIDLGEGNANDLNDSGQVVGVKWDTGDPRAVIWSVPTTPLPPVADAYVRAGMWASTSFGATRQLLVKKGFASDNTRRSYLKFDISHLETIGTASLRLYGRVSNASTARVRISIHRVSNESWDEQTMTWSTKPSYGAMLGTVSVRGATAQWVSLDVTAFVRAQKQAGRKTISLALRALEHTSAYAIFESREAGLFAPQLAITP
jgi:endoglucanase